MEAKQIKRLAASLMNVGETRIRITDMKRAAQAMTRDDLRLLIKQDVVTKVPETGTSRGRAKVLQEQRKKGLRKGAGKRRGTAKARTPPKKAWMKKIRGLRTRLCIIKPALQPGAYRKLYKMAKGGYFRDKAHLMLYVREKNLLTQKK